MHLWFWVKGRNKLAYVVHALGNSHAQANFALDVHNHLGLQTVVLPTETHRIYQRKGKDAIDTLQWDFLSR